MTSEVINFMRGGTMIALLGVAVFFWKFYCVSKDRFFGFCGASFILMSASQAAALILPDSGDYAPYTYWLRLIAFLMIIVGMVAKNLRQSNLHDDK